jgi:hypothetical protein
LLVLLLHLPLEVLLLPLELHSFCLSQQHLLLVKWQVLPLAQRLQS